MEQLIKRPVRPKSWEKTLRGRINVPAGSLVYLYVAYCKGFAKIGISRDPRSRVGGMQSGCPFEIQLLEYWPLARECAEQAELVALRALSDHHTGGEWFQCTRATARYAVLQAARAFEPAVVPDDTTSRRRAKREGWDKTSVVIITPDGEFNTMAAAARHYGVTTQLISHRISRRLAGWVRRPREEPAPDA